MSIKEIKQALLKLGGKAKAAQILDEYILLHYPPGYKYNRKSARDTMGISILNAVRAEEIIRVYKLGEKDTYYLPEYFKIKK